MITKKMLEDFRKDFSNAVKSLEEKYGVEIKDGNIKYTKNSFTLSVDVFQGSEEDKYKQEFMENCNLFNIPKEAYGSIIILSGHDYEIVGINPKKRKYCILVKKLINEETYGISAETCLNALKEKDE